MFHLKNYVFFVRNKNMKIPWDEKFIPSHPVGLDLHPIPSHGIFQKNESSHGMGWDGMGWDGMGLSHPIRSPD